MYYLLKHSEEIAIVWAMHAGERWGGGETLAENEDVKVLEALAALMPYPLKYVTKQSGQTIRRIP